MEESITYKYYLENHFKQFGSLIIEVCHYCPVECAHCHVQSDKKSKLIIDDKTLINSINDFAKLQNSNIVMFTGGDPYSFPEKLKLGLELAAKNNLKSYTLTSGFWAKNRNSAKKYLDKLPPIDLFAVSIDEYHVDKIGIDAPFNALYESIDRGYSSFLCIGHLGKQDPFRDFILNKIDSQYLHKFEIIYYPLLARGSGSNLPELKGRELSRNSNQFCFSVGAPILLSNGNISACCHTTQVNKIRNNITTPLHIGSNGEIGTALSSYLKNNFLKLMRIYGPIKLSELVGLDLPSNASDWDICKSCEYLHKENTLNKIDEYINSLGPHELEHLNILDFLNSKGSIENLQTDNVCI